MTTHDMQTRAVIESEVYPKIDIPVLGAVLINKAGECIGVTSEPAYGWHHLSVVMRKCFAHVAENAGLLYREINLYSDMPMYGYDYTHIASFTAHDSSEPVSWIYVRPYPDCAADYARAQAVKLIQRNAYKAAAYLNTCEPVRFGTAVITGQCDAMRKLRARLRAAVRADKDVQIEYISDLIAGHFNTLPCSNL
jgi:hypothetical protein